jgi:hypothetical protein
METQKGRSGWNAALSSRSLFNYLVDFGLKNTARGSLLFGRVQFGDLVALPTTVAHPSRREFTRPTQAP